MKLIAIIGLKSGLPVWGLSAISLSESDVSSLSAEYNTPSVDTTISLALVPDKIAIDTFQLKPRGSTTGSTKWPIFAR